MRSCSLYRTSQSSGVSLFNTAGRTSRQLSPHITQFHHLFSCHSLSEGRNDRIYVSDVHVKSVWDTLGLEWIRMVYWIAVKLGFTALRKKRIKLCILLTNKCKNRSMWFRFFKLNKISTVKKYFFKSLEPPTQSRYFRNSVCKIFFCCYKKLSVHKCWKIHNLKALRLQLETLFFRV